MNDGSGLTADEQIQKEFGGDDCLLRFQMDKEEKPFHEQVYRQGVTFEWVKNQIADRIVARYDDISLYTNGKRIPEPFCLVDMGVQNGQVIIV